MKQVKGASEDRTPEEWWASLAPGDKAVFHKLGRMVEGLKSNELLRLQSTGHSIEPILIHETGPGSGDRVRELSPPCGDDADEWWNGLISKGERAFLVGLHKMIQEIVDCPRRNRIIEISVTRESFKVALVLTFNDAGGKAELN